LCAPQQFPFFGNLFFQQFFGGAGFGPPRTLVEQALGSGVIVRPNGYVLTNYHVINGAQQIKVNLSNLHTYSAKVVGKDAPSDLAVLKIGAGSVPVLRFADSDGVRVGDVCLALGNPFGVGESVTAGIISAKGRSTGTVGTGSFQDFLQTDAAINQGNSGGALINTRAELIGINSQILAENGGGFIGIGFAIASNMAKHVMDELIQTGTVRRGMLGVTVQPVTSDIAASLGLKQISGALATAVTPEGPGARAGIKQGDVILRLNGAEVTGPNELRNEIADTNPGTEVMLSVWRNGGLQQVRVRLGTLMPEAAGQKPSGTQVLKEIRSGLRWDH
jgi:serine protease Do